MSFKAKYTTLATMLKAITANAKAHNEVDAEWHAIGMSVMSHIWEHRDVSVVNNLVIPMYQGLGKGARHAAMAEWLLTFLPVTANTDQATKGTHPFKFCKDKAKLVPDFEKASATPWYSMKQSPAPDQLMDFHAMMVAAFKKASKAAAEGKPILATREQMLAAATAFGIPETDIPGVGAKFVKSKADAEALKKAEDKATADAK